MCDDYAGTFLKIIQPLAVPGFRLSSVDILVGAVQKRELKTDSFTDVEIKASWTCTDSTCHSMIKAHEALSVL